MAYKCLIFVNDTSILTKIEVCRTQIRNLLVCVPYVKVTINVCLLGESRRFVAVHR